MFRSIRTRAGFTLVELMVVLVIISVLSITTIVLVSASQNNRLATAGQRFESLYDLLIEEALMHGSSHGVAIWQNGYAFYQHRQAGGWQRIGSRPFEPRRLDPELGLRLWLDGLEVSLAGTVPAQPQLWLSPGGATQAFQLQLFNRHQSSGDYRLEVDSIGRRSWRQREG